MRVAIVHPQLDLLRGAERLVILLAKGLARKGYEVTIFTNSFSQEFWGKDNPFAVKIIRSLNDKLLPFSWIVTGFDLKRKLADFDFVNFHGFPSSIWVYLADKLGAIPPTVWCCHEPPRFLHYELLNDHLPVKSAFRDYEEKKSILRRWAENTLAYMDRKIVRKFSLILANSAYTAQKIRQVYGCEAELCYHGISFDEPKNRKEDRGYLLSVTPLYAIKNLHTVIESLPLVLAEIKEPLKYKIIGKGPAEGYLRKLVRRLNLEEVVEFLGFVKEGELNNYYQDARMIIYPCLDEPFGRVILEGASFYLPSIVANHGGPSEIVVHRKTGLQVNALDRESWAEAILTLWREPKSCQRMGEEAFRRLCQNFSAEQFVERFESQILKNLRG